MCCDVLCLQVAVLRSCKLMRPDVNAYFITDYSIFQANKALDDITECCETHRGNLLDLAVKVNTIF